MILEELCCLSGDPLVSLNPLLGFTALVSDERRSAPVCGSLWKFDSIGDKAVDVCGYIAGWVALEPLPMVSEG
jgi:hypothetical protein